MKTSSLETVLGALILLIAAVFLIYSVRAGEVEKSDSGYVINARFNQVGGLQPGDSVRVGGVKIGSVKAITLTSNYMANVAATINKDIKLPVDSAATVASSGLLGGNYLEISPGGDEMMLADKGLIQYTQDAQSLEKLLGQFIFSVQDKKKDSEAVEETDTEVTAPPQKTEKTAPVEEEPAPVPEADNTAPDLAPVVEEAKDADAPAQDQPADAAAPSTP